ncbi:uncharacterized protein N7483_005099 [Penicillium malachiteum]|uniref:uncharacterized protein n=1 Tax=Penicillium malachiteum TaxID=1324776 RepID=UPI00254885B4|nr:uncharacterized protein N7483_005099 [Penicillium malachiteum]KAJ5730591.1 hypothetical protein N7483_005099 [Penicillium malachiteum]
MECFHALLHWPALPTIFWFSFLSCLLFLFIKSHRKADLDSVSEELPEPDCYPTVEPLPNFEWRNVEPVRIRPFKPKYNLTMREIEERRAFTNKLMSILGIQESTVSELIEIDKNYLDRIALRKKIMAQYPDNVLAAEEPVKKAVDEFYTWLVGTYLPSRYPRTFQLRCSEKGSEHLYNLATNKKVQLLPSNDPKDTLKILGGLVEDDFLFLLPSEDGDGYTLKGFVTCFPNGFDTAKKLNLKLRDIHKPVPHYKENLEKSMDRYFAKLKVGKVVKRANFMDLTDSSKYSVATGNHLYEGEEIPEENFDIDKMRLRVERQCLHRLPQSKSLLFSFKTLLYTIPEIKAEGLGESLVGAIDGLREGNSPGFHLYKRAAVWGDFVKEYLRS